MPQLTQEDVYKRQDLYCPGVPYDEVAAAARALGLGVIEYPDQQFDHCEIWR